MNHLNNCGKSAIEFSVLVATVVLFFYPPEVAKTQPNPESTKISHTPAREYCSCASEESADRGEVDREGKESLPNRLRVPDLPIPEGILTLEEFNASETGEIKITYRVIVESSDKDLVRSLYPDAFTITYQDRQVLQAGLFHDRHNAITARESLKNLGLDAAIVD